MKNWALFVSLVLVAVAIGIVFDPARRFEQEEARQKALAHDFETMFGAPPTVTKSVSSLSREEVELLVDQFFQLLLPKACELIRLDLVNKPIEYSNWRLGIVDRQLQKAENLAKEFGYQPPLDYDKYKKKWPTPVPIAAKDFVCY